MQRETDNLCRIEVQPDGAGCLMIFTQYFSDRPAAASYASGWQGCFNALDQVLDDKTPTDEKVSVDVHQWYVKAFGLDIGTTEQAGDRITVEFERPLMGQTGLKVWIFLTDGTKPQIGGAAPKTLVPESVQGGIVTEVFQGATVTLDLHGGGAVCWELSEGPGGPRIRLTHSGIRWRRYAVARHLAFTHRINR